ncbi:hypothetical protein C8Q77DRAFT_1067215 [Trametes polyzona]|nr:hypothetical protein C8Q77DRAFT_1067215 [Trametes polyzona]
MEAPESSAPSLMSAPEVRLSELVERMHANYISLPEVLCATSRPSSPKSEARSAAWKSQVVHALQVAGGDTTHPKWGYVSRITKLPCTSRGYVGIAAGVRVGEGRKVDVGQDFQWMLPEAEAEWTSCERRWTEAADVTKTTNVKGNHSEKATRTSKYWSKPTEEQAEASSSRSARVPRKADLIREKIERWQAQVATEPTAPMEPLDAPLLQGMVHLSQPTVADTAKAKAKSGEKVQASLGFRVVKRSSVTDAKGGRAAASKPRPTPPARSPTPPAQNHLPHGEPHGPSPDEGLRAPGGQLHQDLPHIAEVPELSFFPPSFPSQLKTSTPPLNNRRRKPAPIAPRSPPPSSPRSLASASSKSFDPSRPQRREVQQASSSAAAVSPASRPLKRARTPASSPDAGMNASQSSPRAKKARTEMLPEQEPISSGPQLVPPSTPPPATSPVKAPVTPVSRGKGLGNAKGLPVPTTPDNHALPTLTELLASSRRSKPRPRPPSRKHTPRSLTGAKKAPAEAQLEAESELPVAAEDERDPSPTKTYFSSPASGSSDSASVVHRSPVSPLFSQNPGAFAPRFVSSQRPSANDDDPFLGGRSQSQGQGLVRGSSGVFGMGYNSQFDVEGQIDRVSELLERDVDYNGWLRDLDDADDEPMQTQQSQGAVGVEVDY